MTHARNAGALGITLGVLLASAPAAFAQQEAAPSIEDVALMLGSADPDEVQQAIEATAVLGDPAAVSLLRQRIEEGLPRDLLGAALDALGLLADAESADIFADLTFHRAPTIRVRAVQGLVSVGPEDAERTRETLERALADSDPEVRAAAAQGLGELGIEAALPKLFQAFEVGVPGSGEALARLASASDLDRVLGYLGRFPLDNVMPIVLGLMEREDIPEEAKLRVVARLEDIATAQARLALQRIAEMEPSLVSPRVRGSANAAAGRIAN